MKPATLVLEPMVQGDTWDGIPSITLMINGAPPAEALASVRMRFQRDGKQLPNYVELTSTVAAQITISSAAGWELVVPPQPVPDLTRGSWSWNLETTDALGAVRTFLQGTLEILRGI
jgi:hypothetical protein